MPIPIEQKLVSVAINTRDYLLGKNLILSESVKKYGLASDGSGFNTPAIIGDGINSVHDSEDITSSSVNVRDFLINKNRYLNSDSTKDELTSLTSFSSKYSLDSTNDKYSVNNASIDLKSDTIRNTSIKANQYKKFDDNVKYSVSDGKLAYGNESNESYIEKYGSLSVGKFEMAGNIIGGLLSGQGVGFSPDGIVQNYDIRTTLAGRVLGATGIINDTPLGKAAVTGLAYAMLNNIAFNAQQEIGGSINLNISNVLANGIDSILVPNNDITVPTGGWGKATDLLQKITGLEVPRSFLPESYSIFNFDSKTFNPIIPYSSLDGSIFNDFTNNQLLVDNSGKGQQNALFNNLNASLLNGVNNGGGYAPAYKIGDRGINGDGYKDTYKYKSEDYDSVESDFTWRDDLGDTIDNIWGNKKSLLSKTTELFRNGRVSTMVNNHYKSVVSKNEEYSLLSKGNRVLGSGDKVFCRTWSTLDRYDKVSSLQKHRGLYPNGVAGIRLSDSTSSVLDSNGFVRIAPTSNDKDMKRFMFSLENLAWADNNLNLKTCEIGPGDGKNKGRIMWFPPYNLSFSDSSSVQWESNQFIGRGEPLYTYSNTERTGTLTFKIITDHSTSFNTFKNETTAQINRYLFGCDELPPTVTANLTALDVDSLNVAKAQNMQDQPKADQPSFEKLKLEFYYPNDISDPKETIDLGYEDGSGVGVGEVEGEYGDTWRNLINDGLNTSYLNQITNFIKIITDNKSASIDILGYASSHGNTTKNNELSINRANRFKQYLIDEYKIDSTKFNKVTGGGILEVGTSDQDDDIARNSRKCDISIVDNPELSESNKPLNISKDPENDDTRLTDAVIDGLFCESSYFEYLNENDPIAYANISESLKKQIPYFQPAFHSITPEGFNSRLNFLNQCVRQGPTLSNDDNSEIPSNLAFGRPPVCILRIGDFYHTKIIIDNIDFQFNEVQWDLNPEGIGVQPMIVDVSISFKFIGGSSLNGPIAKLQNAVSFNFFANTEMYDDRSDRMSKDGVLQPGKWIKETNTNDNTVATAKKETPVNQVVENEDVLSETPVADEGIDVSDQDILTDSGNKLNVTINSNGIVTGTVILGSKYKDKLSEGHSIKLIYLDETSTTDIGIGTITKPESGAVSVTGSVSSSGSLSLDLGKLASVNRLNGLPGNITFRAICTDIGDIPIATSEYGWLSIDCPDKGYIAKSLISASELTAITDNPCCECYQSAPSTIINGVLCSDILFNC